MTPLRQAATDYLALRRALGFKLRANEDALIEFTDFLDRRGVTTITAAAAVEWALSKPSTRPGFAADRLRRIRGFTLHHRLLRPRHGGHPRQPPSFTSASATTVPVLGR
jgi:integrase/recombinase XerD